MGEPPIVVTAPNVFARDILHVAASHEPLLMVAPRYTVRYAGESFRPATRNGNNADTLIFHAFDQKVPTIYIPTNLYLPSYRT